MRGSTEGSSAETVLTTHEDGSRDQVSTVNGSGYVITAESHFPPGTDEAESVSYTLELENVSSDSVDRLDQVYGRAGGPEEMEEDQEVAEQDVTLTFTSEDIEEIQDVAREKFITSAMALNPELTEAEAEAALDAYARNPAESNADDLVRPQDRQWLEIAAASSPDEIAQNIALLVELDGGGTGLVDELTAIAADQGRLGDGLPFGYTVER